MDLNIPEECDMAPIHIACKYDDLPNVEKLLDEGTDVNLTCLYGIKPLHLAANIGSEHITALLLNRGANVNGTDVNGTTPLHVAAQMGFQGIVELLLAYGATINVANDKSWSVLHGAVDANDLDMIRLLLMRGADPNRTNEEIYHKRFWLMHGTRGNTLRVGETPNDCFHTVLNTATRNNREDIVQLLLNHGANIDAPDVYSRTPLYYTIIQRSLSMFKLLLKYGANIKLDPDLLNVAVFMRSREIIEILLNEGVDVNGSDKYRRTPIPYIAIKKDRSFQPPLPDDTSSLEEIDRAKAEIAELLLQRGANIHARDYRFSTVLHLAAKRGYCKLVEVIMKFEPDIHATNRYLHTALYVSRDWRISMMLLLKNVNVNAKTADGNTALHAAAKYGNIKIARVLLTYNADVNAVNKMGRTALHISALLDRIDISLLLLRRGADPDCQDKYRRSALHIASICGRDMIITYLLDYGADINCKDIYGETPTFAAARQETLLIFKILLNHQPDMDYVVQGRYPKTLFQWISWNREPRSVANLARQHIVRQVSLGQNVMNYNLVHVDFNGEWKNFHRDCLIEVFRMRFTYVGNSNVTFYHLLTKNMNRLSKYYTYAVDPDFFDTLKHDYRQTYDVFCGMIYCRLQLIKARVIFLKRCIKSLHSLYPRSMPDTVTDMLIDYLSDRDLKNLIKCCLGSLY